MDEEQPSTSATRTLVSQMVEQPPEKNDIPVFLPNWHSAGSTTKSFLRVQNRFEHDLIVDYSGSGICLTLKEDQEPTKPVPKDEDDEEEEEPEEDPEEEDRDDYDVMYVKRYEAESELKFTSKTTTIPFMASQLRLFVPDDYDNLFLFNDQQLVYDENSNYLIYLNSPKTVSLIKLEPNDPTKDNLDNDLWSPLAYRTESMRLNAFKSENQIYHLNYNNIGPKGMIYMNTGEVVHICQFEYQDDPQFNMPTSSGPAVIELDNLTIDKFGYGHDRSARFKLLIPSPHEGMDDEVLTVISLKDGKEAFRLYDMTDQSIVYSYDHKTDECPNPKCSGDTTNSLYFNPTHPRLFYTSNFHSFGLIDMRCYNDAFNTYRCLLKSGHQNHLMYDFETIYGSFPHAGSPHQHVVVSDYHLNLVDERYPTNSLIQWSHSLDENNTSNRLKFGQSFKLNNDDGTDTSVIAVGSRERICMLSLAPQPPNHEVVILQPKSLHSPLHVYSFSDCIKFTRLQSTEPFGRSEKRYNQSKFNGLHIVPSNHGKFSIFGLSNYHDIFCQDFVPKEHEEQFESWHFHKPGKDVVKLDERTQKYCEQTFTDLENRLMAVDVIVTGEKKKQREPRHRYDEEEDELCKCCTNWVIKDPDPEATEIETEPELDDHKGLQRSKYQKQTGFLDKMETLFAPDDSIPDEDMMSSVDDSSTRSGSNPAKDGQNQDIKRKPLPKWSPFSYDLLRAWNIPHVNERIPIIVDPDEEEINQQ